MDYEAKGKLIALEAFITEILVQMDPAQANRVIAGAQAACQRQSSNVAEHSSAVWGNIRRRIQSA